MDNDNLKGQFVIKDRETGEYSNHTRVEGIFDLCATSVINDVSHLQDKVAWRSEFNEYSLLDKKNFVEANGYQLLEPTFDNIKASEKSLDQRWHSKIDSRFGFSRALYTFGRLQGKGSLDVDEMDMDEVEEICIRLANDWGNGVDISDYMEQAYSQTYMERRLLENYGLDQEKGKVVSKFKSNEYER